MYDFEAVIIKVIDGDTFDFRVDLGFSITVQERIRLQGVDTPELRGAYKEFGYEVKEYVEGQILYEKVHIYVYKKGKYGRYVADVFYKDMFEKLPEGVKRPWISLADDLVEKHMAEVVDY